MTAALVSAIEKLRWSVDNGEWSAMLKPSECAAVLAAIDVEKLLPEKEKA